MQAEFGNRLKQLTTDSVFKELAQKREVKKLKKEDNEYKMVHRKLTRRAHGKRRRPWEKK